MCSETTIELARELFILGPSMLYLDSESRNASAPARVRPAAFTLIELLVVIAIIAILASLLLPSLNKGKLKAQNVKCMSSHRQLCFAWRMYSEDNQDALLFASEA